MAYAPYLTEDQIERIREYAKPRQVVADEVLYEPGFDTPPVYVVISGAIRIVAVGGEKERTVTTYRPTQFSGELLMISGRRSIYRCQAVEAGTLLALCPKDLRTLIGKDAELSDIIMNAFLARRLSLKETGQGNVVVLGSKYSTNTLAIREFLTRDGHPFNYFDLDSDPVTQDLLNRFDVAISDIPVVICNNTQVLKNPSTKEIAECLGFNSNIDDSQVRDLVIVGAGPAGLAAAVYAASEGLDVLVVEKAAPGGQAGSSSKIENYLGFPTGLSGQELADRAIAQAEKFGARIMVARSVERLSCDQRPYTVALDDGHEIPTRTIVLAIGAQYNKPALPRLESFSGKGIYYNSTFMEAQLCTGEQVIVIGGGNSAGQAAVFLSQNTAGVTMLVRSNSLADTMSRYLIQRIEENPLVQLHYSSELTGLEGDEHLECVEWRDKTSGKTFSQPIRHVFMMTGASPKTDWLSSCLALDRKGFILTGRDLETAKPPIPWLLDRPPYMLEASLPGVFVVGDARSGNVKRVASAVGEGSIVLHLVHQALTEP
ncbi:cyclic nucleotide-binding domain-containing thioredoxin-disulfide reductase [Acidobacterium sp. S8]|uniref:FAD-dependent oxidoreductase n=1 Tax=Acidobacterium sp. S8 TaxID=1641854 RepID=UPI00131E8DA8|nr:cyclic nucleotide-binding domain-containing thioredoxin-disulfide reductase [Acidobacterium sp. S8]